MTTSDEARDRVIAEGNPYISNLVRLIDDGTLPLEKKETFSLRWLEVADLELLQRIAEEEVDSAIEFEHRLMLVADLVSVEKGTPGELTVEKNDIEKWVTSLPFLCSLEVLRREGAVSRGPEEGSLFLDDCITWSEGERFIEKLLEMEAG